MPKETSHLLISLHSQQSIAESDLWPPDNLQGAIYVKHACPLHAETLGAETEFGPKYLMCGEIAFTHLWLFSLTFNVSSELLHCHCPSQLNRQAFSLIKIDSVAAASPPPQVPQWLGLICPDNQQGATLPCPPCTPVTHIEHLLHCTAHDNETFWLYLTSRWLPESAKGRCLP
jgi:hypothetical protein